MARIKDVSVGQVWRARVSSRHTLVRVDAICEGSPAGYGRASKARLSLTNLVTKREISRTAAFLRGDAPLTASQQAAWFAIRTI